MVLFFTTAMFKNGFQMILHLKVKLDDYEGSLFASLFWMVGVICSPMGGFLSGWLGRRKIILLTTPLVAIGWIIIGCANNKLMLYLGRIISSGTMKLILNNLV